MRGGIIMEFAFPKSIWLKFYRSKNEQGALFPYMSRLVGDTMEVKECIKEAKNEYGYMIVEGNDYHAADIYEGLLDEDAVISRLLEVYHDHLHPLAEVDPFILTKDFMEKVCRYLEAAKVLVSGESDMEEIIYQRDVNYAEEEDVQKCIDTIKSIRKV